MSQSREKARSLFLWLWRTPDGKTTAVVFCAIVVGLYAFVTDWFGPKTVEVVIVTPNGAEGGEARNAPAPSAALPGAAVPGAAVPGAAAPGATAPGATEPNTATPDRGQPAGDEPRAVAAPEQPPKPLSKPSPDPDPTEETRLDGKGPVSPKPVTLRTDIKVYHRTTFFACGGTDSIFVYVDPDKGGKPRQRVQLSGPALPDGKKELESGQSVTTAPGGCTITLNYTGKTSRFYAHFSDRQN